MPELSDDPTVIGSVHIYVNLREDGTNTSFALDGVSAEEAIGRLTVVTDRLREIVASGWEDDLLPSVWLVSECPHCGEVIDPNEMDDEEEDDGSHE